MIDVEVERLRRLRASALQLRAVARALKNSKWTRDDALLNQGSCAAWRVARTVTGWLRAHPNSRYQRDAGLGLLFKNSLIAIAARVTASSRHRAMCGFGAQLKSLMRELDNARALTWAAELSDTFGRSQREIRTLMAAVQSEAPELSHKASTLRELRPAAPAGGASPFLTM